MNKLCNVNNKYNLNFLMLIVRTFSVYVQKICIKNNINLVYAFLEYYIHIEKEFLLFFFKILKSSLLFNYNYLSDIVCVDNLNLKKNLDRFTLSYFLQNNLNYSRIALKILLGRYESIISVNSIFLSSIWVEREIYDLFGIFFVDNMDLRRILTDYGFYGFPLQKDFPLTGYLELRYCEELKCVKYSRVKLMQEYRNFNFLSPWQHYLRQNTNFVAFD